MSGPGGRATLDLPFEDRVARLVAFHRARTGTAPTMVAQAPGRVNLLGEHTDYSGGFCMPAALDFNTLAAGTPVQGSTLTLHSLDFNETATFDLTALKQPAKGHWSAYCAGVAWSLEQFGIRVPGAALSLTGNVPFASGLSSSASVEVAVATALLALAGTDLPKVQVALACQRAENDFVGAPCGIMDQFISACGVRDNALAIDTRALTAELAPLPAALRLVITNSMVRHSVATGEYGVRRREVEEAARVLGERNPDIKQLRDATLADLEAARDAMGHEAFLRARHVISDSGRVGEGVAALRAGDVVQFGRLMNAAHISFRDDFAASCPECDRLVELAQALPGCLGSRLTGGGFGGCTVSLVEAAQARLFADTLQRQYREAVGVTADVFICEAADGASPVAFGST